MPVLVAALDADVLVPILPCDFLLTAFDLGLYEPVVSTVVIEEVERTLAQDFPHLTAEGIQYRVEAMRSALDDQLVTVNPASAPDQVNAKDRHVVAAAQAGEATMLVSNDRRLRDQVTAARVGFDAVTLDQFALKLWGRSSEDVNRVIDALVAKRRKPAVSRDELLDSLAQAMPELTSAIRAKPVTT